MPLFFKVKFLNRPF